MVKIISLIITFLNIINKLTYKFQLFLMKFLPNDPNKIILSEEYKRFKVNDVPIIKPEHLPIPFEEAKLAYEHRVGKPLTKVKLRSGKPIDKKYSCPHCGASHEYLYSNNGKLQTQLKCKVCEHTFSLKKSYTQDIAHFCPHCGYKLAIQHSRTNYIVYKCYNRKCSFYKSALKALSKKDKKLYKENPSAFTLHYNTRVFDASLDDLAKLQSFIKPSTIDLSRIRNSKHVLGLILTYYINYGLSLRKTALIMFEVHNIKVSHQTIANYAEAASHVLKPWLDEYQYDLTPHHCGDETYVSVKGKKAYVFFICDSVKKIITAHNIFMKRDTFSAIQTFYAVLRKFRVIPEDLNIVVDGNPIYLAAQQYFSIKRIFFKVTQVIGLTNDDPVSAKYRPSKQIIERLNRTFKATYQIKNGFSTIERANEYMCLFTTYFNFLRNHSSLKYKPPVSLELHKGVTNMPAKWNLLIENSIQHNIKKSLQA